MQRVRYSCLALLVMVLGMAGVGGCSSGPSVTQTGFVSDYSQMDEVDGRSMSYVSPRLAGYERFVVDDVRVMVDRDGLSDAQWAEVRAYAKERISQTLREHGYGVERAGRAGSARVRVAITGAQRGTWWLNLHPGMKIVGVGRGGASLEAEIVDWQTGEQLAAAVRAGRGDQLEIDTFNATDDIKDVIDVLVDDLAEGMVAVREHTEQVRHTTVE